jgi:geranylgeranyl diphosphate synthase type II
MDCKLSPQWTRRGGECVSRSQAAASTTHAACFVVVDGGLGRSYAHPEIRAANWGIVVGSGQSMKVSIDYAAAKADVRQAVEDFLHNAFSKYPNDVVSQAAQYAVLGGGHRWRAIVAVAAGQIFDDDALKIGLPGACGVELAHAASLVLDDLPSMDNAQIRRGKPCAHLVFPQWVVDMTPVFLVSMAYRISLENPRAPEGRRVQAACLLSSAGLQMIAGQTRDIRQDFSCGAPEERLLECYHMKSAALYAAAAKAGSILCGASECEADSIYIAGLNLGMSYQLLDDVADVTAGVSEVGKHSSMDAAKWTAVDWLGVDGARRKSHEFQLRGLAALEQFGPRANWLRALVCEASCKPA